DSQSVDGIVDILLAQTGEGIMECEFLKWFVNEWARFSIMETISMMKILLLESVEVMKNCSSHIVTGHMTIHLNIYMKSLAKVIYLILGFLYKDQTKLQRVSNERRVQAFSKCICQHLGSKPVLPYLSLAVTDKNLPLGANIASARIGILNDMGFQFAMTGHRAMIKYQIEEKYERKVHHHTGANPQ
nr:GDSL esterase/lipase At4g28780 [Tanacetum cinerariifolium]